MQAPAAAAAKPQKSGNGKKPSDPARITWKKDWQQNKVIYFIFIPVFLYVFITHYLPMFGIVMSFQDFKLAKGVFGSDWVGFKNFIELFSGEAFPTALRNTIIMSLFNLTLNFAAPLIFALLITNVRWTPVRRVCQTMSYLPNFVAAVVVANLVKMFIGYDGALTALLTSLGFEQQNWLANPNPPVFWLINCFAGIWQSFGYGSIVYVAAISNINQDLYEAAALDGANRWQRTWKITLPSILPLIIMMFTLQIGLIFKMGYDKILLLYMPQTYSVADCLYTYTYRMGFGQNPDFGLAAASSLFQSLVGTALLLISNKLSRKTSSMSLF